MVTRKFLQRMPKVELHVHLEGSIRPETVLELARRNDVQLPAMTVEGLREWYRFRDFPQFVEVYVAVSKTIRTAADIELIAREFLRGQAEQNILHSEVTYTASTIERFNGIPWDEQIAALNRARAFGEKELGVTMGLIIDIVRGEPAERGLEVANWVVGAQDQGVIALGLAGEEKRESAGRYQAAYDLVRSHGIPVIPHAGETQGAWSISECLDATGATRVGHGIRCLEDEAVVRRLIDSKVTLEVCPTSNVCLGGVPNWESHPLPVLMDRGVLVTINSDDPPMFGTTLTQEYERAVDTFGFDRSTVVNLAEHAAGVALVSESRREELLSAIRDFNSSWVEDRP